MKWKDKKKYFVIQVIKNGNGCLSLLILSQKSGKGNKMDYLISIHEYSRGRPEDLIVKVLVVGFWFLDFTFIVWIRERSTHLTAVLIVKYLQ